MVLYRTHTMRIWGALSKSDRWIDFNQRMLMTYIMNPCAINKVDKHKKKCGLVVHLRLQHTPISKKKLQDMFEAYKTLVQIFF